MTNIDDFIVYLWHDRKIGGCSNDYNPDYIAFASWWEKQANEHLKGSGHSIWGLPGEMVFGYKDGKPWSSFEGRANTNLTQLKIKYPFMFNTSNRPDGE